MNENSRNHRRKGNCNLCLVTMLLVEIEITMFELHLINTNKFGTDFFFFFFVLAGAMQIFEKMDIGPLDIGDYLG